MKGTACHRLCVVINLINVKMVKVLDNDFRILMNTSLEILTVYKLEYHFGSLQRTVVKPHSHVLCYHTSLNHKINCMGKRGKCCLCTAGNSSRLNIIWNAKGKLLNSVKMKLREKINKNGKFEWIICRFEFYKNYLAGTTIPRCAIFNRLCYWYSRNTHNQTM